MPALNSSALSWVDYDPDTEELTITFTNGRSYAHQGVPEQVYQDLLSAPSAGSYYSSRIKGVYG